MVFFSMAKRKTVTAPQNSHLIVKNRLKLFWNIPKMIRIDHGRKYKLDSKCYRIENRVVTSTLKHFDGKVLTLFVYPSKIRELKKQEMYSPSLHPKIAFAASAESNKSASSPTASNIAQDKLSLMKSWKKSANSFEARVTELFCLLDFGTLHSLILALSLHAEKEPFAILQSWVIWI